MPTPLPPLAPGVTLAAIVVCLLSSNALAQPSADFPFPYQEVDVSGAFSGANLRRDTAVNPAGIFTSDDSDTSSFSDSLARRELEALGESGEPSIIRYIDVGRRDGPTFLLFHGTPTTSYLWRNVIPQLAEVGRVVAFDQIGYGRSSRHAGLTYTFKQHVAYTEAFVEALGLADGGIIPVVHDTGGAVGFSFAERNRDDVRGLVFFETVPGPAPSIESLPQIASFFRSPEGQRAVLEDNAFFNLLVRDSSQMLFPSDRPFTLNPISDAAVAEYGASLQSEEDRRVLAQFIREVPILGGTGDPGDTNIAMWLDFAGYLTTTETPKLTFFADPGVLAPDPTADFIRANLNAGGSLTAIDFGPGFHFLQEDNPELLGREIASWFRQTIIPEPSGVTLLAGMAVWVLRRRPRA